MDLKLSKKIAKEKNLSNIFGNKDSNLDNEVLDEISWNNYLLKLHCLSDQVAMFTTKRIFLFLIKMRQKIQILSC